MKNSKELKLKILKLQKKIEKYDALASIEFGKYLESVVVEVGHLAPPYTTPAMHEAYRLKKKLKKIKYKLELAIINEEV